MQELVSQIQVQFSVITAWMGDCHMLGFVLTALFPQSQVLCRLYKNHSKENMNWDPPCALYTCKIYYIRMLKSLMDHGNAKIAQHALKVGLQNVEFGHNTEKEGYVWLWCLSCPKSVTKVETYLQWPDMINFHMAFFAYVGEKRKTKRMCLPRVTKRFPFICEEKRIMHIPVVTTILTGVEGEVIAQLVERPTEKPDAILTQVESMVWQVVVFLSQSASLMVSVWPLCAITCINICARAKNPKYCWSCCSDTKILPGKGNLNLLQGTVKYWTVCCAGEPFTQEELEEMMSQAMDPEKGYIPYKDYASLMAAEETWHAKD